MFVIRVIYRWTVPTAEQHEFAQWWHERTSEIRDSEPGAMGSALLRSTNDDSTMIGIARWQSVDHLNDFRRRVGSIRYAAASLDTIEIFDEVDDLTRN